MSLTLFFAQRSGYGMDEPIPKISVITPSFNQAQYIEETIKSVLRQEHQSFEHIIIDGGSTDGTLQLLERYPHLRVICEPDQGQADAVNKGLRSARGEIIGWLNSDDTYLPGTFESVERTILPADGIYIVMGRCAYINAEGTSMGREHPSRFSTHRRVVEIWKDYTIPQPAVFFHRSVYESCGGLDENLYFALDYDLFLRYSRSFKFHMVDEVWATYRLHYSSKTTEISQGELLEKSLVVSKRYWGSPMTSSFWRYFASYWWYGGCLGVASLKEVSKAVRQYQQRQWLRFGWHSMLSLLLFAPTFLRQLVLPSVRARIAAISRKSH